MASNLCISFSNLKVMARLPSGCSAIATTSRGIVGTSLTDPVELENLEAESSLLTPALSMLLIPQPPGAKILPFHLAEHQLEPLIADIKQSAPMLEDEKVLQAALLQRAVPSLQDSDKVKAIVLLSNGLDLPFSMHIIQVSLSTNNNINNNNNKHSSRL